MGAGMAGGGGGGGRAGGGDEEIGSLRMFEI